MSKKSLAELQAAFSQKASGESFGDSDWKKFYPFYKIDFDQTAKVRFLPDLNDENPMGFLVENLTHTLTVNGQQKKVPCLSMYGERCPVCEKAKQFYDEKDEENGRKYYKKRSYVGQVLVVESPIEHDESQLVKLIEIGPKIFKKIQAAFASGDLENPPYDFKGGYDFRLTKSKSGQWADYTTSSFSPRATDLSDDLIGALELYDLMQYRTKEMSYEAVEAMLLADLTGGSYEDGHKSNNQPEPKNAVSQQSTTNKVEQSTAKEPVQDATPSTGGSNADYIRVIRERAAAKKAAAAAQEADE